jgi:hypothetical protein
MVVAVASDEHGPARAGARPIRVLASALLVFAALFYLLFGAHAVVQSPPQAAFTFLGALGLGWGALRTARGERAAGAVWLATTPLFVLQVFATMLMPDESPAFVVGAGIAPASAGMTWLLGRRSRAHDVHRRPSGERPRPTPDAGRPAHGGSPAP